MKQAPQPPQNSPKRLYPSRLGVAEANPLASAGRSGRADRHRCLDTVAIFQVGRVLTSRGRSTRGPSWLAIRS